MLDERQRAELQRLAHRSIEHGLRHGRPLDVRPYDYDDELRQPGASFVTLKQHGTLRGCIGMLEARRPLVRDIAENAYAAAFRDTRFQPLQQHELDDLELHISILGTPEHMVFSSEQELLSQLRPGTDGIILTYDGHRATFLPSVWEQIDSRTEFMQHLKRKAGLAADFWDDAVSIERYEVEEF